MAEAILTGTGLTKRFGGLVAVDAVDLAIPEGEIIGLIGPNGAGKSTLFRLIAGILPPSSGRVAFRGADITGHSAHDICIRGVVATHQIVRPFRDLTVLENVLVGAFFGKRSGPRNVRAREGYEALRFCSSSAPEAWPAR